MAYARGANLSIAMELCDSGRNDRGNATPSPPPLPSRVRARASVLAAPLLYPSQGACTSQSLHCRPNTLVAIFSVCRCYVQLNARGRTGKRGGPRGDKRTAPDCAGGSGGRVASLVGLLQELSSPRAPRQARSAVAKLAPGIASSATHVLQTNSRLGSASGHDRSYLLRSCRCGKKFGYTTHAHTSAVSSTD